MQVQTKNKLYCFDGLKQSINAALQLADDKFKDQNCKEKSVKTRKLNSDPVEKFFSTVRQRNGFNNEPSVAELGKTLARITSQNIRDFSGSTQNCEAIEIASLNKHLADPPRFNEAPVDNIESSLAADENDAL